MVEVKDILLKAAEDVQSGMWCRGRWFSTRINQKRYADDLTSFHLINFRDEALLAKAQTAYRCAEGSIELATALLGGRSIHADAAREAVEAELRRQQLPTPQLYQYNDSFLPDDPFEAGQQLAELFRSAAESL